MTAPLLVGISGATGVVYGVEILRALKALGLPRHLILSEWGAQTLAIETDLAVDELRGLADTVYSNKDLAAAVSSGSYPTRGMVIAPCSIKTLSGIANSYTHNLMIRAADVTLKERRPLILMPREAPLSRIHLSNMLRVAEAGATLVPCTPSFYNAPATIEALVDTVVARVLDQLAVPQDLAPEWGVAPSP